MAAKELVKIPVIVFYIIEADADGCPWVTEFDPATLLDTIRLNQFVASPCGWAV